MKQTTASRREVQPKAIRRAAGAAVLLLFLALAGCSEDDGPSVTDSQAAEEPQTIRVTVDRKSLDTGGVTSLDAGWTSIVFETRDQGSHGLALVQLEEGVNASQLLKTFKSGDEDRFLGLATFRGGFVGISDVETHTMTTELVPGRYVLLDIGGEVPNFLRGLRASLEVVPSDGTGEVEPKSDGDILLHDFSIDLPEGFSGRGTFAVRNQGRHQHELNLAELPEDTQLTQRVVTKWAKTGRSGIDAHEVAGLFVVGPGTTVLLDLDLRAGNYVALCGFRDESGPHAALGMWDQFNVR